MKMTLKKFISEWFGDWWTIFNDELKMIFKDSGVMIIFFLAGLAYPILYNLIYHNGTVDDMPIAVVDKSNSADSRRFARKLDATREVTIAYRCTDMTEAEELMQERKVHGIVLFPSDYDDRLANLEQATVSTYEDMSSFLYYKNLLMAANHVMLDELSQIQTERYAAAGFTGESAAQLVEAMPYEENIPYNPGFAYCLFFLPAALMLVIQQTMFYGVSMMAGTMRERNRSFATLPDKLQGRGITRVILGRGSAYGLIYLGLGSYIAILIPALFGLPRNGITGDIFVLLLFYIVACILFSFTFSTVIRRRETVFALFLFFSPVCLFLTGFSWPQSAFPPFWKFFSWLFPSTFAAQGFINMNAAGATLDMIKPQMIGLTIQIVVYYITSAAAITLENRLIHKQAQNGKDD